MKKLFLFLLVLAIFCGVLFFRNNNPKVIISRLKNQLQGDISGKKLKYRVYFFGVLPVGEALFSEEKAKGQEGLYHLSASANVLPFIARFFSGSAKLDSLVDIKSMNPVEFRQKVSLSGKPDVLKIVKYDQKNEVMELNGVKRKIYLDTQDPLSAVFRMRKMDFSQTKEIEIGLNTNQKNYILRGSGSPRELKIGKILYRLVLADVVISRRDKNPYHRSSMTMVLWRDKQNLPILFKVFASGVFISVKLISVEQ